MFDIDIIIPCYGPSSIIDKGIASIAHCWKHEYAHVTLVDDCSPNTDCHYQDLVDKYKGILDIRCIVMPENSGQGLTRQYGIDHTSRDYFMFMDEDDQFAELAISIFVEIAETYGAVRNEDGSILIRNGKIVYDENVPKLAVISGPLFEWDDNHTHVIEANNHVWLNSKLYSRAFIEKHDIRFNKPQSRHAEDYFFTSCFFYCLDFDNEYTGLVIDNNEKLYYWYPNGNSQSRVDPHYSYMLAGYTMDGSVNILDWIKNGSHKIEKSDQTEEWYKNHLLNMTVYSWFNYMSFIRHVATTDYIPKLEEDWTLLRDACNTLREKVKQIYDQYSYIQRVEEIFIVHHHSDATYTDPFIEFDDYILNGHESFKWDLHDLLMSKKTYKFTDDGRYISPDKDEYNDAIRMTERDRSNYIDWLQASTTVKRKKRNIKTRIMTLRKGA